ncbi:RING-H2 finger protein ATL54-like [Actinidia eriantha]|uniref:RING-H2 finger protein ATL54-like n=1 Tax=Actinidia eriantha TaxID=165200 RepID=UPI002590303E|nr:RING-H2 finger protein ATL54-like [Actinidia eriantha]
MKTCCEGTKLLHLNLSLRPRPPYSLSLSLSLMASFNHRKLIFGSANINITEFCGSLCDPIINTKDSCPIICHHPLLPSPPPPPPPPPDPPTITSDGNSHKLHIFLTLSLSILATACFLVCCYTLYKYYKNWDRSRRTRPSNPQQEETHDEFLDEDHGPILDHPIWYIRTVGLESSIINSITIFKYKRGDGLVEGTECSVCLSEFQEDEILRLLPKCSHAFHIPCIDTWLRSHTNCPMCRAGIVSNTADLPPLPIIREEEAQVVILEREREDGDCESRTGMEEGEREVENRGKIPQTSMEVVIGSENLGLESLDDEVQPMRRSVSLDSLSASMVSFAIANSGAQLAKGNKSDMAIVPKKVDVNQSLLRLLGSSSIGRSLQQGPISMKRSLSCSGKVLFSRYAQGRTSILPS